MFDAEFEFGQIGNEHIRLRMEQWLCSILLAESVCILSAKYCSAPNLAAKHYMISSVMALYCTEP